MPQNNTQNSKGWKKYPFKKLVIKKCVSYRYQGSFGNLWIPEIGWWFHFSLVLLLTDKASICSLFLYQHFKATISQWWDLALKGSLKVKVQAKKSTCPKLFLFSVTRMHLIVFCPENFPLDFIQYCITLFFTQKSLEWKHEQWSVKFKIWIQASIHIRTNTPTMNRDEEHTSYLQYGPKWFPPSTRGEGGVALTECWFFMSQLTPSEACLGLLTVVMGFSFDKDCCQSSGYDFKRTFE